MSREALIARLKVAEDALVLVGWTSTALGAHETERSDAAHQMWSIWCSMIGSDLCSPDANQAIDSMIPELAAQRRAIRERTLRAIREELRDE